MKGFESDEKDEGFLKVVDYGMVSVSVQWEGKVIQGLPPPPPVRWVEQQQR